MIILVDNAEFAHGIIFMSYFVDRIAFPLSGIETIGGIIDNSVPIAYILVRMNDPRRNNQ